MRPGTTRGQKTLPAKSGTRDNRRHPGYISIAGVGVRDRPHPATVLYSGPFTVSDERDAMPSDKIYKYTVPIGIDFGPGAIAGLAKTLSRLGANRPLFVCDKGIRECLSLIHI